MSRPWNLLFRFVLLPAAVLALLPGCKKQPRFPTETRALLGTQVTVTIYDIGYKQSALKPQFDEIFAFMDGWGKRVMEPGPQNEVLAVSRGAGQQSVPIDPAVFDLLMKGIRLYDNSGKAFDIRYGPILDAWGFDAKSHVPSQSILDSLRGLVTDGGLFVAGKSILLAKPGMRFDVRGMAIGYILDMAAAKLAEKGFHAAVVHTPTVWRFMGDAPKKEGFEAMIPNPANSDSLWATVHCGSGGLAIVSEQQNRFTENAKNYHSILDPRTGWPATRMSGAIVQSKDAAAAQALAYALFVQGSTDAFDEEGKSAVLGSAIVVSESGREKVTASGSLAKSIETR